MKEIKHARVYRIRNQVALHFDGVDHTVYVEPAMAEDLISAIYTTIADIKECEFAQSYLRSMEIGEA